MLEMKLSLSVNDNPLVDPGRLMSPDLSARGNCSTKGTKTTAGPALLIRFMRTLSDQTEVSSYGK